MNIDSPIPERSHSQQQGHLLDETELEQGVGKYRKLLTGGRLPVHAASHGFQIMLDESGKAVVTPQGYDTALGPTHQMLWQGIGVAGPSTKPTPP